MRNRIEGELVNLSDAGQNMLEFNSVFQRSSFINSGLGTDYKHRFPTRRNTESANATGVSKNIHLE